MDGHLLLLVVLAVVVLALPLWLVFGSPSRPEPAAAPRRGRVPATHRPDPDRTAIDEVLEALDWEPLLSRIVLDSVPRARPLEAAALACVISEWTIRLSWRVSDRLEAMGWVASDTMEALRQEEAVRFVARLYALDRREILAVLDAREWPSAILEAGESVRKEILAHPYVASLIPWRREAG